MLKFITLISIAIGACIFLPGTALAADEGKAEPAKKLRVLVVAGGHDYEVEPFRKIFKNYADMDCTFVEEKTGGEAIDDIENWPYDALVLYNYERKTTDKQKENFLKLLDRGVGLVVLHHGIYGYLPWPEYRKVVGFKTGLNAWKDDVDYKIHVEDAKHPITQGVTDFPIKDETYLGYVVDPKVHVILTTDEPLNAKTIAWTHTYRNSPVCYLQSGHGPAAYENKSFVTILGNAIRWTAKEAASKKK
jgi:type 1 glutamine amidotransferase